MSNLKKACEMALNEEMEKMDKAYAVSLIDGHIDRPTHTDNEIIKALECLMHDNCEDCPYYRDDCADRIKDPIELSKYALDLINRQKAEIERLKRLLERAEKDQITLSKQCYKSGIKEFAERLKEICRKRQYVITEKTNFGVINKQYLQVVDKNDIDNLVKKMVGDTE